MKTTYKFRLYPTKEQRANPRGTSKEYEFGKLDRDYNAALNILFRGLSGLGRPFEPVKTRPLQVIPTCLVVETGSPSLSGVG